MILGKGLTFITFTSCIAAPGGAGGGAIPPPPIMAPMTGGPADRGPAEKAADRGGADRADDFIIGGAGAAAVKHTTLVKAVQSNTLYII